MRSFPCPGAVEERTLVVAGDEAIGDRDILGEPGFAEAVRGLEAETVVPRRVDRAIGDTDVLASVDVDAIAPPDPFALAELAEKIRQSLDE